VATGWDADLPLAAVPIDNIPAEAANYRCSVGYTAQQIGLRSD
jgi:hypothetical protein